MEASEAQQRVVSLSRDASKGNTRCVDCDAPTPQWRVGDLTLAATSANQWHRASVSFGIFICLTCSGVHRSLGVHCSFVRSVTMDNWSSSQAAKMQHGGNAQWRAWCQAAEGYSPSMTIQEKVCLGAQSAVPGAG